MLAGFERGLARGAAIARASRRGDFGPCAARSTPRTRSSAAHGRSPTSRAWTNAPARPSGSLTEVAWEATRSDTRRGHRHRLHRPASTSRRLRRLGVEVAGVVGSTPGPRTARRRLATRALREPSRRCSPTAASTSCTSPRRTPALAAGPAALAAGKHVVCEKPLAMTSAESAELLAARAKRAALVHAVNFNLRFYPLCRSARERSCAAATLGDVWHVHGGVLQDWLLLPTDWNWRLEPRAGRRRCAWSATSARTGSTCRAS